MSCEAGSNLAQLDTEPSDLYLEVELPQIIDVPIWPVSRQIPGAIKPRARLVRMGDELLDRQFRPVDIPARQALASDQQFPGDPHRRWLQLFVQIVDLGLLMGQPM